MATEPGSPPVVGSNVSVNNLVQNELATEVPAPVASRGNIYIAPLPLALTYKLTMRVAVAREVFIG